MRSSARSAVPALLTLLCVTASVFAPAKSVIAQPTSVIAQPTSVFVEATSVFAQATSAFAQEPTKQPAPKTPHGSVSGRVTIKEKPAAGVVVGLRKSDLISPYEQFSRATTDADGVYRITNVPTGSYQLTPAAPGFVISEANARLSVIVAEDENVEGMNFSLVRGGVITGKITDADGRPLIAQQVQVYRVEVLDQRTPQRPVFPESSGYTDDRGIYRIFGLPAGRYKVAAGRGEQGMGGYSPNQLFYKQVFHPDVAEDKATIIQVTEGSEANNVDITLGRPVQTFSATGRVINGETGSPVPGIRFGLQRFLGQRVEFVNTPVNTNGRGDFIVEGLIPGKYGVVLFSQDATDLRPEVSNFEIVDQDITDVVVKLTKGASITGVVVIESEDKAALSKLTQMQMRGYTQSSPGIGSSASSLIAGDGSFRLAGLGKGAVNVSLSTLHGAYPPKGFSITRIERDGIASPRLELKDGEQITGVKVFVGYGNATLRGVVNVENGPLPAGARIYLRLTKPGEKISYLRPPQVDERGHFLLEGIPAGLYELSAYVVGGNIKQPKPVKRDVSLTDGIITDVSFSIDLAAETNPQP